jgi:hypothetical protein
MKRVTIYLVLAAVSVFALQASTALAGSKGQKYSGQNRQNNTPRTISTAKPKKECHPCKDKGKCDPKPPFHCGTGQPGTIVDPVHVPPVKIVDPVRVNSGGFVWVNGHWERPRAGQSTIIDPTLVGPIVRDHRTPTFPPFGAQGGVTVTTTGTGPIIRDHRGLTTTPGFPSPIVRDHRGTGTLGTGLPGMVNTIGGEVAGVGRGLGNAAGALGHEVLGVGQDLGKVAGTLGRDASRIGSGIERGVIKGVTAAGNELMTVGRGVQRAENAVKNAAESAVDAVGDFLGF